MRFLNKKKYIYLNKKCQPQVKNIVKKLLLKKWALHKKQVVKHKVF